MDWIRFKLASPNFWAQKKRSHDRVLFGSDQNGLCQLVINAVAAVLDRDDAGLAPTGNDGDRFAAVAAQRKEKSVQLLVIGIDLFDDVFFADNSVLQSHTIHRDSLVRLALATANPTEKI